MYLERVDIVGFRGINRISLSLDDNTVLIGENAWGKSSLLDALTLLLSPEPQLYHFTAQDFYYPAGDERAKERHLQVYFLLFARKISVIGVLRVIGSWPRYGAKVMMACIVFIIVLKVNWQMMIPCVPGEPSLI